METEVKRNRIKLLLEKRRQYEDPVGGNITLIIER